MPGLRRADIAPRKGLPALWAQETAPAPSHKGLQRFTNGLIGLGLLLTILLILGMCVFGAAGGHQ